MEDVLKRLFDAESRAEAVLATAEARRTEIIEAARLACRQAEADHLAGAAGRRAPLLEDAEARAGQLIAEAVHRHEARLRALRELAERNEADARAAVLDALLAARG